MGGLVNLYGSPPASIVPADPSGSGGTIRRLELKLGELTKVTSAPEKPSP